MGEDVYRELQKKLDAIRPKVVRFTYDQAADPGHVIAELADGKRVTVALPKRAEDPQQG